MTNDPVVPEVAVTNIPIRMVGVTTAVRVTCDGETILAGAFTANEWREALGVREDYHLWAKQDPNDVLVEGEFQVAVEPGIVFYTAPRRISDS